MRAVKSLLAALPVIGVGSALGAQVWQQPIGYIGVEENSNLDLQPGGEGSTLGYVGSIADLIGIATPTTQTTLKPRLDYRDYPSDSSENRLEEYLDFNSTYKGQRSTAAISGELDHRDELSAELNQADYNDINPNQPTSPQTGQVVKGATRDSVYVVPSYAYNLTQKFALGVEGLYQKVNYSPNDDARYVDFYYWQGKVFGVWTLTQNTDMSIGAYDNRYNATRYYSVAKAEGGSVDVNTSWTPLFSTRIGVVMQHTEIDTAIPPVFSGTNNTWGASFSAFYHVGETQQVRADLSRIITPSGGGSVYANEQAQVQYDKKLTQRLSGTIATIYIRNRALTENFDGNGRDYLRSLVELKWNLTPTWFIQGGYQYFWERYTDSPDGAANNRVYIRIGYQGLNRQW